RAVRTPSRIDRELIAPGILTTADFQSENVFAYELGYRAQPTARASLSVSLFYNRYDDLRTTELSPQGGLPLRLGNGGKGETYGVEVWGDYQVFDWWRMSGGFSLLGKH